MRLLLIAGARPNFMKIAPFVKAIDAHNRRENDVSIAYQLVHTGQHYDQRMSEVFFRELGIPQPDVNLEVGSGSHASQTASVMMKFEPVCEKANADWVIVVGDVNSTMACALVASKLGVKIAHVEAGLRSFDRSMPEEINRLVTDAISDLLLTPSADANQNLENEGIPKAKIKLIGNIMIDTLCANLGAARASDVLQRLGVEARRFSYVTLHRPSNVDHRESLTEIVLELIRLAERMPIVFPVHPRTHKLMREFGLNANLAKRLILIEPVGYHDSLCLTENARLVLTDSGGLQEEATFFRTPCLTLRPNTERPVTVNVGSNRLTSQNRLAADVQQVLSGPDRKGKAPDLWDGHTADRILKHLLAASFGSELTEGNDEVGV